MSDIDQRRCASASSNLIALTVDAWLRASRTPAALTASVGAIPAELVSRDAADTPPPPPLADWAAKGFGVLEAAADPEPVAGKKVLAMVLPSDDHTLSVEAGAGAAAANGLAAEAAGAAPKGFAVEAPKGLVGSPVGSPPAPLPPAAAVLKVVVEVDGWAADAVGAAMELPPISPFKNDCRPCATVVAALVPKPVGAVPEGKDGAAPPPPPMGGGPN